MATIFYFSSQTREESTATSDTIVDKVIENQHPDYEELTEAEKIAIDYYTEIDIRTYAHHIEFCALSILLICTLFSFDIKHYLCAIIGFVGTIIYALSDEFHQWLVPDRHASWLDIWKDIKGALIGLIICITAYAIYNLIKIYIAQKKLNKKTD